MNNFSHERLPRLKFLQRWSENLQAFYEWAWLWLHARNLWHLQSLYHRMTGCWVSKPAPDGVTPPQPPCASHQRPSSYHRRLPWAWGSCPFSISIQGKMPYVRFVWLTMLLFGVRSGWIQIIIYGFHFAVLYRWPLFIFNIFPSEFFCVRSVHVFRPCHDRVCISKFLCTILSVPICP